MCRINKPEVYRNKAIVHFSVLKITEALTQAGVQHPLSYDLDKKLKDLGELIPMYKEIIFEETLIINKSENWKPIKEKIDIHKAICDFCNCDIFSYWFSCKFEHEGSETFDLCCDCVALGRWSNESAQISKMEPYFYISTKKCLAILNKAIDCYSFLASHSVDPNSIQKNITKKYSPCFIFAEISKIFIPIEDQI